MVIIAFSYNCWIQQLSIIIIIQLQLLTIILFKMPLYLYVLALQQAKYYVGITNNVKDRLEKHSKGQGSFWTKRYPLKSLMQCRQIQSRFQQDKKVKQYMDLYGIDNVRGGSYLFSRLTREQYRVLSKQMRNAKGQCYKCGSRTHFIKQCQLKDKVFSRRRKNINSNSYKIQKSISPKIKKIQNLECQSIQLINNPQPFAQKNQKIQQIQCYYQQKAKQLIQISDSEGDQLIVRSPANKDMKMVEEIIENKQVNNEDSQNEDLFILKIKELRQFIKRNDKNLQNNAVKQQLQVHKDFSNIVINNKIDENKPSSHPIIQKEQIQMKEYCKKSKLNQQKNKIYINVDSQDDQPFFKMEIQQLQPKNEKLHQNSNITK